MRTLVFLIIMGLSMNSIHAQSIQEKSINAQIGYGLSAPYNSAGDIVNSGFFIQGELVLKMAAWIDIRPYTGFITTSSNGEDFNGNPTSEKAETTAVLLGGKLRFRAPIPWVAPFIEIGVGTSIGSFTTLTFFDSIDKSGIIGHIPFSIGLELGRNNNVDLAFSYYFQPSVQQYTGAFAVGLNIPLNH